MANSEQEGVEAKIASLVQEAIEQRLGLIIERLSPLVTQSQANRQPTGGESKLHVLLRSGGPSVGRDVKGGESKLHVLLRSGGPFVGRDVKSPAQAIHIYQPSERPDRGSNNYEYFIK